MLGSLQHCHGNVPPLACRSLPQAPVWSWHTLQTPFCQTSPPTWWVVCSFPGWLASRCSPAPASTHHLCCQNLAVKEEAEISLFFFFFFLESFANLFWISAEPFWVAAQVLGITVGGYKWSVCGLSSGRSVINQVCSSQQVARSPLLFYCENHSGILVCEFPSLSPALNHPDSPLDEWTIYFSVPGNQRAFSSEFSFQNIQNRISLSKKCLSTHYRNLFIRNFLIPNTDIRISGCTGCQFAS